MPPQSITIIIKEIVRPILEHEAVIESAICREVILDQLERTSMKRTCLIPIFSECHLDQAMAKYYIVAIEYERGGCTIRHSYNVNLPQGVHDILRSQFGGVQLLQNVVFRGKVALDYLQIRLELE